MAKINLTAKTLARLKPGAERADYFDTNLPGFCVRVTPGGVKSFSVMYRHANRLRRYTIGTYPPLTLADARDQAKAALRDAEMGEDPAAKKKERRQAGTFEDLTTEFMERYAKKRKRSWPEDQRIIDKHLLPRFRHARPGDVARADVRVMLEAIAEEAPIQANRVLACLRKIYNWGISQDLVEANPCHALPRPGVERRRDRVLSEDELKRVWTAIEAEDTLIAGLFKLRLLTAQRGGEVETMRWEDVDLKNGWWTIPAERSKNGLAHRVPLTVPAVRILEAIRKERQASKNEGKRESPWVFPHRRRPEEPIGEVQKALQRIRAATAGPEVLSDDGAEVAAIDFRAHDLRRTAASMMTGMGIPRVTVGKILNHVERGVTAVYDRHSYDKEKRQALDKWGRRLTRMVSDLKAADSSEQE